MNDKPAPSMIDLLTPIWQRALKRSSICTDENFFDLGGDAAAARQLFADITQTCGRELEPATICQAPTLAALAKLLEEPSTPQSPPLVLLRRGSKGPPIFIAPGLGDSVLTFCHLVQKIDSPRPIYGLQARGVNGVEEPLDRVEDMAERYLKGIRDLQPQGPYALIGASFGGLVMLEIAQRLSQDGKEVALLSMLDTYPHKRFLSLGQRVRVAGRLVRRDVAKLIRLQGREAFSYVVQRAKRRLRGLGSSSSTMRFPPPDGISLSPSVQRMRDGDYLAWTRYQPRFYRGRVRFVRAQVSLYFPEDAAAVWTPLVDRLGVDTVPGDHYGIITTQFEALASVLSRHLRGASQ